MQTVEPQYNAMIEHRDLRGVEPLGLSTNFAWNKDPKRLLFTLARYKFVASQLIGQPNALEVGCGDAFGTRIVQQVVPNVVGIDIDPVFIDDVRARVTPDWPMQAYVHDMLAGPFVNEPRAGARGQFYSVYSLDVLEHIRPRDEFRFLRNVIDSMVDPARHHGVAVIGMPSLASQHLASKLSREGHVNCKSGPELRSLMLGFFHNVSMFSMNDEVVHTGHHAMAHYLLAVCTGRRA